MATPQGTSWHTRMHLIALLIIPLAASSPKNNCSPQSQPQNADDVNVLHRFVGERNEDITAMFVSIYRVSQEERTKPREGVPYVKLYRYNPKHLYPKLNGYGDNGQRKAWTSCISA